MIRVLTMNRQPYPHSHIGGDEIQRVQLARNLRGTCKITHSHDDPTWREQPIDIIHSFNIRLDVTLQAAELAQERHIPLVVNTIHLPGAWYDKRQEGRRIVEQAAALICNVKTTPHALAEELNLPVDAVLDKSYWVPVGAPAEWHNTEVDYRIAPQEPFVLFAARYEERKGQVEFLKAWLACRMDAMMSLYMVGDQRNPVFAECRRLSAGHPSVHVLGPVNHDDLKHWFSACRVSVLPTLYDNPGMTNLEAAICGAAVVTTDIPSIREYFGDRVRYGQAGEPYTYIPRVVASFTAGTEHDSLRQHVLHDFTWKRSAADLLRVYQTVLGDDDFSTRTAFLSV